MTRSSWHIRTSAVVLAWMTAAATAAAMHRQLPAATWLMVHLLLLGAVTTALLVWSWHFSVAVLHAPQAPTRRGEAIRITTANIGALGVISGVMANAPAVTILGAAAVAAAVAAHVVALAIRLRHALPGRFAFTVRAYIGAGLLLVPGIALGVVMARGSWDASTYSRLLLGHVTVNLLGWVVLPILGTLVTLWPTMLHTRLAPDAEQKARRALPLLIGGTLVTTTGALTGLDLLAAAGVAGYLIGIGLTVAPMVTEMRQRPPSAFASWSALAGVAWLSGTLVAFGIALVGGSADALSGFAGQLVAAALIGGVLQVLLGSLSYLVPVMVGGGPAAMRRRNARVNRAMAPRLVMLNTALAVCVLPSPSAVRVLASTLVLVAVGWTILLIADSLRRSPGDTSRTTADSPAPKPPAHHSGGGVVALAVVLLAIVGGVAYDPAAVGAGTVSAAPASAGVTATGEATEVTVTIEGMRFTPDRIQVPAGNTLTVTVMNGGDDVHDLVLETGQRTPRLSPGQAATIEVGVIGRPLAGWCSVAGHRQMGMVLSIEAIGGTEAATAASGQTPAGHTSNGAAAGSEPVAVDGIDLMAEPGPGTAIRDPRLPPAAAARIHRVRLVVTEVEAEVAPGVRQTRWTFGGTAPGPVLRGKVGDTFIITLVNDGSIGHSIDFHAGALAPDEPMRTIAPGETLAYRFTATRAGIWMYHCSTMPMSMHIANGMFGAVIIDPPDLAPVDREFVLVQSESYLGPQGGTADADSIDAGQHNLVAFNGYPMQYDHAPLQATVGDRVRIWVLAAGPNVGSSFHVVGGQFDTVYREGAYELTPGTGGSQVLGLFPAQGGFVELVLPEAGTYPFVSHVMSDAEKGAHGLLHVSRAD
ncbi:MAG: multicopper oxidase domain-containing protein [Candidatus Nanopelagicales bacterium]|nr:multicopper oxidase domain-containing protein [Candidatus Nanopelagicales bacterium]MCF8536404.1 multicopper oxidase domain-containing protein [Candidatus Nanopelagicales bacterium]MCF8541516.1 multicopper oxidase domain-containing protein [Candidatus Nanopelagicales bacterium]